MESAAEGLRREWQWKRYFVFLRYVPILIVPLYPFFPSNEYTDIILAFLLGLIGCPVIGVALALALCEFADAIFLFWGMFGAVNPTFSFYNRYEMLGFAVWYPVQVLAGVGIAGLGRLTLMGMLRFFDQRMPTKTPLRVTLFYLIVLTVSPWMLATLLIEPLSPRAELFLELDAKPLTELDAIARDSKRSYWERCDAVIVLGGTGDYDERLDERIALLDALTQLPDIPNSLLSVVERHRDNLESYRYRTDLERERDVPKGSSYGRLPWYMRTASQIHSFELDRFRQGESDPDWDGWYEEEIEE